MGFYKSFLEKRFHPSTRCVVAAAVHGEIDLVPNHLKKDVCTSPCTAAVGSPCWLLLSSSSWLLLLILLLALAACWWSSCHRVILYGSDTRLSTIGYSPFGSRFSLFADVIIIIIEFSENNNNRILRK